VLVAGVLQRDPAWSAALFELVAYKANMDAGLAL